MQEGIEDSMDGQMWRRKVDGEKREGKSRREGPLPPLLPSLLSHVHRPGCPLMHLVSREIISVRCGGTRLTGGRRSRQTATIFELDTSCRG